MTPERQYVLNQIERARETERRRRLAAAEARRRQYKTFGDKTYYWAGWKLNSKGTRTTTYTEGYSSVKREVAVTCKGMRVSTKIYSKWSKWRIPSGDEQRMVIELCSQIPGAPRAVVRPAPKAEVCTGSRIDCASKI